jgi:hypothetical protein
LLWFLIRHFEIREHRGLNLAGALFGLAYLSFLSWFTGKTAEHMVFEDRKLGASLRLAVLDLRFFMGFLPFVGRWLMPPSDKRDDDDKTA